MPIGLRVIASISLTIVAPTLIVAPSVRAGGIRSGGIGHHEVTAVIDVSRSRIDVTDVVTFETIAPNGEPLEFLLHRGLAVQGIRLGDEELVFEARDRSGSGSGGEGFGTAALSVTVNAALDAPRVTCPLEVSWVCVESLFFSQRFYRHERGPLVAATFSVMNTAVNDAVA